MPSGVCPFAIWRGTTNFGYPKGRHDQNKPLAVVDHIMGGYKSTMDDLVWLNGSGISSHFGIGPGKRNISQYVNIFDASYANGVVGQSPRGNRRGIELYDRTNPILAAIEKEAEALWYSVDTPTGPKWTMSIGAGNAWNTRTITKEHQGVNQNTPWDEGMVESSIAINRWINDELSANGYPTINYSNGGLIGHSDIDHIDRPYCPGPGRPYTYIVEQSMKGSDEVFTRLPQNSANPNFWNGKEVAGPQGMDAWGDFNLGHTLDIEVEVSVNNGGLDIMDGGTADGLAFFASGVAHGRVKLDPNGAFWMRPVGSPVIDWIRCVGYYS